MRAFAGLGGAAAALLHVAAGRGRNPSPHLGRTSFAAPLQRTKETMFPHLCLVAIVLFLAIPGPGNLALITQFQGRHSRRAGCHAGRD